MKRILIYVINVFIVIFYVIILGLTFKLCVTTEYKLFYIDNETNSLIPEDSLNIELNERVQTCGEEEIYFLNKGWYSPESEYTWSKGNKSTIFVKLNKNLINKDLNFSFSAFSALKNRDIIIYFNDYSIGELEILSDSRNEYEITIPKEYIENNGELDKIKIKFKNKVKKLSDETDSDDERRLGIALFWFEISD